MAQASSARRNWCRVAILGAAILAAVGCAGKDKNETGPRGLDPRVKAALTAPAGQPGKDVTKSKLAIGDPAATVAGSSNRKVPNIAVAPSGSPVTGTLASSSGVPTQPTSGGLLVPQKPLEQVKYDAPPVMPLDGPLPKPLMPLDNPIPSDVPAPTPPPQPIIPAGAVPGPFPPPSPPALPIIPDTGSVAIPSPNEKSGTGFPIEPPALK